MNAASTARFIVRGAIVLAALGVVGLLGASVVVPAGQASGHAQFHALFALVALGIAGVLVTPPRGTTLASLAPSMGLLVLALAQVVEGVGAFGYGPDGNSRANGLVALHDLGFLLMPVGLMAVAVGVAVGIGAIVARRSGRPKLAVTAGAVVTLGALVAVAKLIGL
jgi:hypothetical protein